MWVKLYHAFALCERFEKVMQNVVNTEEVILDEKWGY